MFYSPLMQGEAPVHEISRSQERKELRPRETRWGEKEEVRRREKATNSRSSRVRRKRKDPLRKPRAVEVGIETGPENCQTANGPSKSGEFEFGHISPHG